MRLQQGKTCARVWLTLAASQSKLCVHEIWSKVVQLQYSTWWRSILSECQLLYPCIWYANSVHPVHVGECNLNKKENGCVGSTNQIHTIQKGHHGKVGMRVYMFWSIRKIPAKHAHIRLVAEKKYTWYFHEKIIYTTQCWTRTLSASNRNRETAIITVAAMKSLIKESNGKHIKNVLVAIAWRCHWFFFHKQNTHTTQVSTKLLEEAHHQIVDWIR